MKIKEVDQLKLWLINAVSPLCDAEPEDLAKYVLALLKKDKSEKELEQLCRKELEIFFKNNTLDFITNLFSTLSTESYITNQPVPDHNPSTNNNTGPTSASMAGAKPITSSSSNVAGVGSKDDAAAASDGRSTLSKKSTMRTSSGALESSSRSSRTSRTEVTTGGRDLRSKLMSDSNVDEHRRHDTERRRRRSRSRDRSRSNEHRRKTGITSGGNSSSRYSSRHHRYHEDLRNTRLRRRSRDRSRSKERLKKRSRSPQAESGFRSAKYFPTSGSKKRSRSHSNSRQGYEGDRNERERMEGIEEVKKLAPARSRSSSVDLKDDQDYRITVPLDNMMGHTSTTLPPSLMQHNLQQFNPQPPIYLGTNPNLPPTQFLTPPPNTNVPPPQIPSSIHQETRVVVMTDSQAHMPMAPFASPPPPLGPPQSSLVLSHPPPSIMHHQLPPPPHYRPTPTFATNMSVDKDTGLPYNVPPYIPTSIKSRLGYKPTPVSIGNDPTLRTPVSSSSSSLMTSSSMTSSSSSSATTTSTSQHPNSPSLLIDNIPLDKNNISSIDQHFSKFGTILNIQVNFNGNPKAALVSFSNHHSAEMAFNSSEPVFNNRFIEVKWYPENSNHSNNNINVTNNSVANISYQSSRVVVSDTKRSVKDRLGGNINNNMKIQFNNNNVDSNVTTTTSTNVNNNNNNNGDSRVQQRGHDNDIEVDVSSTDQSVSEGGKRTVLIVPSNTQLHQQQQQQQQSLASTTTILTRPATTTTTTSKYNINYQTHSFTKTRKPPQIIPHKNEIMEQKKEVLKRTFDYMNRKRQLVEDYIKKQKEILEELQKPGINSDEKNHLKDKLEKLKATIQLWKFDVNFDSKIGKSLSSTSLPPSSSASLLTATGPATTTVAHKFQTSYPDKLKKELLDLELEEISRINNGEDASEIQSKIQALKYQKRVKPCRNTTRVHPEPAIPGSSFHRSMTCTYTVLVKKSKSRNRKLVRLGPYVSSSSSSINVHNKFKTSNYVKSRKIYHSNNNKNSGTGGRGGGGGGLYLCTLASRKVDRRPKQLVVSGFEPDKKNDVINHLGKFGNMERFNDEGDVLLVTYSTRKEAENAALLGADFGDIKLKLSWPKIMKPVPHPQQLPPPPPSSSSLLISTSSSSNVIDESGENFIKSHLSQDDGNDATYQVGGGDNDNVAIGNDDEDGDGNIRNSDEEDEDDDDDDSDTMIELVIEDDGTRELVDQSLDDAMLDDES